MAAVNSKDFEKYLSEARSWETNRLLAAHKSERLAWRIASLAGLLCAASIVAVAALAPFKTVEPYVIRVDNSTGIVDVVSALKNSKSNYEESVNKFFVQWYLRYREGFSRDLAEEYYYAVGLMSSSQEQQRYFAYFDPRKPTSPMNVYGDLGKVKIVLKSTSFIQPNVALVRYSKEVQRGADLPSVTHWAATITFRYSGAPMAEKDRAINPLGFQVTEYRNDPDSLVVESRPQAIAPAPANAAPPPVTLFPTIPVVPNTPPLPPSPVYPAPIVPAIQPGQ